MGRGVGSGRGQSSLGYLFGTDEAPKPAAVNSTLAFANSIAPVENPYGSSPAPDGSKQTPSGIQDNPTNNHFRADWPDYWQFITV
ncbi:protein SPIRAL1-like 2 [Asparagus officinalis]|uniref:protein SPIRAL1-like 2 n=1 Tax=Asparagus officinalis TaxID=4686 RepID=UPI00098E6DF2|nr:protein SPIRAL1-like 2 [Asparagus officinalis]